jgi:hypothetical protein
MSTLGNEFGALLGQYNEQWLGHVARFEQKLELLHTLKRGMELLLLVSSFLFYYLIDCIAQIMAMPLPFVR